MKISWIVLAAFIFISFTASCQQTKSLLPEFATLQYAGSIGYVSAGLGYHIFKSKARVSLHYGIVPPNQGGKLNVISTKLFFNPASFTIWNRVRLNPFDIGVMASYHYGDNFETRWPEGLRERNYYWWNPALRAHLAMESSVTYEFKKGHRFTSATGYFEFNTNELYFVSFIQNARSVSFWDIVKLGTGVRVTF